MLSGIIAYQVARQENPATIEKVKAVLEKHPWYANQWQAGRGDVTATDRDMVFIQAARWPDDIRRANTHYHRGRGTISTGPLSPKDNRPLCKSEVPNLSTS
jgi:hypothetical protein